MADYFVMGTGDIDYVRETPVLKAFLPLINRGAGVRVAFHSRHGYPHSWVDEDFIERLGEACAAHGLDSSCTQDLPEPEAVAVMMEMLYVKVCEMKQQPQDGQVLMEIRAMAQHADAETASVKDVVRWLRLLDDGHGLSRVIVSEAYTSDALVETGAFGGGILIDTAHVHFYQGSNSVGSDVESMSRAIERGDTDKAATFLANYAARALYGIKDASVRSQILERAVLELKERFGADSLMSQPEDDSGADEDHFLGDVPH